MTVPVRARFGVRHFTLAIPKRKRPRTNRFTVPPGCELSFILLNPQLLGVETHYDAENRRTLPCTHPECWYGPPHATPRLQAWCSVWNLQRGEKGLLCVTEGLLEYLPSLADSSLCLAGMKLTIWRSGKEKNSPMKGRLEDYSGPHQRHQPLNVLWHLERFWTGNEPAEGGE